MLLKHQQFAFQIIIAVHDLDEGNGPWIELWLFAEHGHVPVSSWRRKALTDYMLSFCSEIG